MNILLKTLGMLATASIFVVVGCTKSELDSNKVPASEVSLQDNLQNENEDNQGNLRRPWLALISIKLEFGHKISAWSTACQCWETSDCQSNGLCRIEINGAEGGENMGEIAVNQSELSIIIPKANFDRKDLYSQFSDNQFNHPVDLELDRAILTELTKQGFSGDLSVIEAGSYDYIDREDEIEIVILKD